MASKFVKPFVTTPVDPIITGKLLLLLLLTSSHCWTSICWENFTYPRLLVLCSVCGRKVNLSAKVKGHVIEICVLNDTFVIILIFAPLFRHLWFNLYSVDILGSFGHHSFRWNDYVVHRHVVNFSDIFDFQGQVFIFRNFLCLCFGNVMCQENCYINHTYCFILSMGAVSGLLKSTVVSVTTDLSKY